MALSNLRKRLNFVAGLLLLAGLGYAFLPFIFGRSQMQHFCPTLPIGGSVTQVNALVVLQGYKVTSPNNGVAFVYETRSMGRFNCVLHFDNKGLVSAAYEDNS